MNNINSRVLHLLDDSMLSNPALEAKTGIKSTTWANLRLKKIRLNEEHLEAVIKLFPEYAYWITTGKDLPEAGQISPEIEETRKRLSTGT
ncbi:DNA-binding protein [Candidatus Methylobacter oryzae]|uniref:DNA-binding protein n=1 Tax=Candidatus Methylobacter oryzae TaxID=2497749 RepID=A0ABY3CDS8_9GAMM|nr:DNA-binding protein [Candidatus Methylobacter oryzae]TRW95010.1 DNA-binding protein [Candidatus Methylobacter oryzae]